ncbi:septal ring lytic transglycosylase RlpA family protein [Terriglobus tenax]|uniref:septal ring lytic transglycosylase RlpA family protein n=1 Tax=Terriglobus tenax TaxID=1111115 RepID=UPI0021DF52E9|nr:septal ring lytic transglycosylase RlpA family protein [Terriglobus tenax]
MIQTRSIAVAGALLAVLVLTGCHHKKSHVARRPPPPPARRGSGSSTSTRNVPPVRPVPGLGSSQPEEMPDTGGKVYSSEVGMASWYGPPYHNRNAANGQPYDQNAMTAAHRTLPMGTVVRVTNVQTGQQATVKITDRGPFVQGRVLDLSMAAAKATGVYRAGVAKVKIEVMQQTEHAAVSGKWCVQVGAFSDAKNSLKLKDQMQRRYHTAKVIEFPGPTGHWVRINPSVMDKAHATEVAESIRPAESGAQAYLVRLD